MMNKSIYKLPGEEIAIDVNGNASHEAAKNIGAYLFTASEDYFCDLDPILDFLQKCRHLEDHLITKCVSGYLNCKEEFLRERELEQEFEFPTPTEIWVNFGALVAEYLGIDDSTYYDRSGNEEGELADEAKKAIDFIAAVPKTYITAFLVGMGQIGFKTETECEKPSYLNRQT